MAKTAKQPTDQVCVHLRCTVVLGAADALQAHAAGSVVNVPAADAQRLIDLGAAIRGETDDASAPNAAPDGLAADEETQ